MRESCVISQWNFCVITSPEFCSLRAPNISMLAEQTYLPLPDLLFYPYTLRANSNNVTKLLMRFCSVCFFLLSECDGRGFVHLQTDKEVNSRNSFIEALRFAGFESGFFEIRREKNLLNQVYFLIIILGMILGFFFTLR